MARQILTGWKGALEYGKMTPQDYCPHGFARITPNGKRKIICGFCDPEAYEKRMKEVGLKYPRGGSYNKRVRA